jgi:hypothetical protein
MRLEIPQIIADVKKTTAIVLKLVEHLPKQEQNLHFYNSSTLARILKIIHKRLSVLWN